MLQGHHTVAAGPGSALVSKSATLRRRLRYKNKRSHQQAEPQFRHWACNAFACAPAANNAKGELHCGHDRPPEIRKKNRNIQMASIACQYMDAISTAVPCAILRAGRKTTTNSAMMPPAKCTPCAAVIR